MRIVMFQRSAHPNTLGWADGLTALGHSVVFGVTLLTPKTPGDYPLRHVKVMKRTSRMLARMLRLNSKLKVEIPRWDDVWSLLARPRADLVMIKTQGLSSIVVSLVALVLRVPRMSWTHLSPRRARIWRSLAWIGVMPRRQLFTSTSLPAPQRPPTGSLSRWLPFCPRDVRTEAVLREPGPLRVLTVGEFRSARKRLWWTLEAARLAGLLDGLDVTFTFVGHSAPQMPERDRIIAMAQQLGITDRVAIRTDVAFEDMPAVYQQHDVLVLPSRDEPFGMVVMEAMAHGLAVICSDTAGASASIDHGQTGLIFDAARVEALAKALGDLASESELVRRLGESARVNVHAHASPPSAAATITALMVEGRRET